MVWTPDGMMHASHESPPEVMGRFVQYSTVLEPVVFFFYLFFVSHQVVGAFVAFSWNRHTTRYIHGVE